MSAIQIYRRPAIRDRKKPEEQRSLLKMGKSIVIRFVDQISKEKLGHTVRIRKSCDLKMFQGYVTDISNGREAITFIEGYQEAIPSVFSVVQSLLRGEDGDAGEAVGFKNGMTRLTIGVKFSDALMPECIGSFSKSEHSVCNKDEEGKRDGSAGRGKSQAWHAGVTKAVSSFAVMPFLYTEDGVSRLLQPSDFRGTKMDKNMVAAQIRLYDEITAHVLLLAYKAHDRKFHFPTHQQVMAFWASRLASQREAIRKRGLLDQLKKAGLASIKDLLALDINQCFWGKRNGVHCLPESWIVDGQLPQERLTSFLQRRLMEEFFGDAQPINQANKIPPKDATVQASRPVGQGDTQVIVAREQNASAEDSGSSDEDESEDEQAASDAGPSSATHEKAVGDMHRQNSDLKRGPPIPKKAIAKRPKIRASRPPILQTRKINRNKHVAQPVLELS